MDVWAGIDGGGTKTELVLVDSAERIAAKLIGPPTNPHAVGFQEAMQELQRLITTSIEENPSTHLRGIALGLAGVSTPEERKSVTDTLLALLQERQWHVPVLLRSEAEIALMAAIRQPYGAAVISGTGSNTVGITKDGRRYQIGGWGHILGDEGSGYQIGIEVLKSVMRSYHGILPATVMTDWIMRQYQFRSITELKGYIYQKKVEKADIAAFAKFAIEAARNGDPVAAGIVDSEAGKLVETAIALLASDEELLSSPIVLIGSVFAHSERFTHIFQEGIKQRFPQADFIRTDSTHSPAYGAALLAKLYPAGAEGEA